VASFLYLASPTKIPWHPHTRMNPCVCLTRTAHVRREISSAIRVRDQCEGSELRSCRPCTARSGSRVRRRDASSLKHPMHVPPTARSWPALCVPTVSPAGCKPAASAGTALPNWGAAQLGPLMSASAAESPRAGPAVGFYEHGFELVLPSAAHCIKQRINRRQSA